MAARTLKTTDLARGIKAGDRATLARAITLIESKRADHRKQAHLLVQELLPATGKAVRLGITGAPGAGKSTTIDVLGTTLTGQGHKVAVLAVDPSSSRTGGSILGDKTRMAKLASDPHAFVRPSPSSGTLGGVAAKTRETMLLCEAAGYDVVLVETVGIGQSETAVADMTDFLPGADAAGRRRRIAGPQERHRRARRHDRGQQGRRRQYGARQSGGGGLSCRAQYSGAALGELVAARRHFFGADRRRHRRLWAKVLEHKEKMTASGEFAARRREQQVKWMWSMLEERLTARLRSDPAVRGKLKAAEAAVAAGKLAPTLAVEEIAQLLGV